MATAEGWGMATAEDVGKLSNYSTKNSNNEVVYFTADTHYLLTSFT